MGINMEEEYKFLPMGTSMTDSMGMENQKGMESIIGTMEQFIGDNSKMEFVMGMDNGLMERKNIKDNT